MSNLQEVSEFTATVNQINDGDDVDHIVLNGAPQSLANRTKYLNETKAPIDSPSFTGTPQCPTPANTATSAQLINAAFYANQKGTVTPSAAAESGTPGTSTKFAREDHTHPANMSSAAADMQMNGTASAGTSSKPARADHVHPTDNTRAPINSPSFTGTPTAPTPPSGDSSTKVSTTEFVLNNGVPAGTVIYVARTTAPTGYIKANGAQVSRTTYSSLFAAIGTTFGAGDGSTTFNLPDMRGVFPRGYDDGRGLDPDRGGAFGTYEGDQYGSHSHTLDMPWQCSSDWGYPTYRCGGPGGSYRNTQASGGTETRPKNVNLLACIKY